MQHVFTRYFVLFFMKESLSFKNISDCEAIRDLSPLYKLKKKHKSVSHTIYRYTSLSKREKNLGNKKGRKKSKQTSLITLRVLVCNKL